jgi:signal transduction histidine kinase/CheY-like chemotaxis protein
MLPAWSVLGFVLFLLLFRRAKDRRLGRSTAVWVALLLLIFFTSMIWTLGAARDATNAAVAELTVTGTRSPAVLTQRFDRVTGLIFRNAIIQFAMILASVLIIFHIYSTVRKEHRTAEAGKTLAEQSSQAKTNFLSNMSHDIRTPMNAIIGYVTLAKREKDAPPKVKDYLEKIEASSDHLLALINDVLEISRIESGRMELMPIPTDLHKMMEELRGLFSTQMEAKGLTFAVAHSEIEDHAVLCDQNRFNRVLLNLLSNACKFTPEGGSVTLTLRQEGREEDRALYRVSVKDTGIGMSPEFAAQVFEAYAREKTSTVENIQRTGLGTAITKSIVELMGGSIEVFSEQGKGSEFVIRVGFDVDPEAREASARHRESAAAKAAFAGKRLLLVEDDPANREVERILLEEAGFVVDLAENGEDAVECIAASPAGRYDAVLMDIEMPVKNGYDATRLIRSLRNAALAEIPIAALSARAFSEDISACYAAGMNAHIAKPLNMNKLLETMSALFADA